MIAKEKLESLCASVEPDHFMRWMHTHGWVDDRIQQRDVRRFVPGEGEGPVVLVPTKPAYGDYALDVYRATRTIAKSNDSSWQALLQRLVNPKGDVLRMRFHTPDNQTQTIPLTEAIRVRQETRRMLLSMAHSKDKPQRTRHPKLSSKAFVDQCLEAPAEAGSYVTPIVLPADSANRKITDMLLHTLATVRDPEFSPQKEYRLGVTSNFLEALSELGSDERGTNLEITLDWALDQDPIGDWGEHSVLPSFDFGPNDFSRFADMAGTLSPALSMAEFEVKGLVETLKDQTQRTMDDKDAPPPATSGGVIILYGYSNNLKPRRRIKVEATLEAEDYRSAIQAHYALSLIHISEPTRPY